MTTDGDVSESRVEMAYKLLSILEAKASGLLTLNGIIIAIAIFMFEIIKVNYVSFVLFFVISCEIISCIILLRVANIIFIKIDDVDGVYALLRDRVAHFKVARNMSIVAIILIFIISVSQGAVVGLAATRLVPGLEHVLAVLGW